MSLCFNILYLGGASETTDQDMNCNTPYFIAFNNVAVTVRFRQTYFNLWFVC